MTTSDIFRVREKGENWKGTSVWYRSRSFPGVIGKKIEIYTDLNSQRNRGKANEYLLFRRISSPIN